ncbi:MAG: tandem-95 repeat protein, partial [Desulfobulbaceae bacterium]|nr:tandem-95 repeat protein [Desulfobulbaceae bacterium]
LTLTGTATIAEYQTALRSITYENTLGVNATVGSRTVQYVLDDGTDQSAPQTSAIIVNQAPVVTAGGTLAYTEHDAAAAIDTTITVADADNTNLQNATVTVSAGYLNGEDVLAFADFGNITGSWDAATGVLTLTGSDTVANYQSALRTVTYVNSAGDDPTGGNRTISFVANDGKEDSSAAISTVAVTAVNDGPILATNAGLTVSEGATAGIPSSLLATTDVDNVAANITYTVQTAAANGTLKLNGASTGTFTQDDLDNNRITYEHDGGETLADSFVFSISDGAGGTIGNTTFSITIGPVNDAPVLDDSGSMTFTAVTEDTTAAAGDFISDVILSAGGDRITDAEGDPEGIAVVSVDDSNGVWYYDKNANGLWTAFTGNESATQATLLNATAKIKFIPDLAYNNAQSPAITFRAWDATSGANGDIGVDTSTNGGTTTFSTAIETASISVTAVNDASVLDTTMSPAFTVIQMENDNSSTAVNPGDTVASLLGGSCSDVDFNAAKGMAITSVTDTNGAWQYSTDGGATWASIDDGNLDEDHAFLLDGDNTSHMVRFSPNAGYHGSSTMTFRAWDQSSGTAGNYADATASGGTTAFSSDSDTASIKVNKSPAATDEIVSTGQDISVTITVLANDTDDDGDSLSVHEITQNPSFGSVSINSDNTITYTPAYSYHGPDRFMYTVKDNFGGFDTAVVDITVTETFGSYINTSNAADAGIEPGTAEAVQLDEGPSPEEVAEEAAFDMNAEAEEAADDVFYGTGEDPVLAVASVDTKIEILENRNNQEFIRLAVMSREDQMAAQYGLGKNSQIIKYGAVETAKEMSLQRDTYEQLAEQLDDINRPGASVFDRAEPIVPEPEATLPSVPSLESGEEGAATGTESGTDAEAGRIIAAQP